jgi:predicted dehydrogenase
MGQRHGAAAEATDGLEMVAACDPDPARRKAAEADFPSLRAHASLEELAADEGVEVEVVATPPASHASIASFLLQAGKHVVIEKPMCLTVSEADMLIAEAGAAGRALTVNQNRRWDSDFRAIQRVLGEGLLGELFCVETFVGSFEHPCRAWHSEQSISGGAVYDWGSHHLDWALALMDGPPATVTAHGHKRVWHDVTNLDQLRVNLTWADGREAQFVQSEVAAILRPKFYLQGTAGTLVGHYRQIRSERVDPVRGYVAETAHHAEAPAELVLVRHEPGWGLTETRLPPMPELAHPFHRNLADHLLLGEPLAVTPESVRQVTMVMEAATASARAGGTGAAGSWGLTFAWPRRAR